MFEQVEAYYRPTSVREALRLLESGMGRAKIVAGGTDLVVDADSTVRALIDLSHCGLSYVRQQPGACIIGATTTLAELEESPPIQELAGGILAKAAATCGSVQIRNTATVGGNIANGSPAADLLTPLLALDAEVVMADATGKHTVPIARYLQGAETMHSSLLVEVLVPAAKGAHCGWSFQKLGRTAVDISIVNVAAGVLADRSGRVQWARIALGAVAPTAIRAAAAEASLRGHILDAESIGRAADIVTREVAPISDVRASADYRREMCRVLTRRALEHCSPIVGCTL